MGKRFSSCLDCKLILILLNALWYNQPMVKGIEGKRFDGSHVSGSVVEKELLGEVGREYVERFKGAEYVPYCQALAMVKESQPFDPADPEPRFASDLHATVADKLGLEDYSQLKFYTAVSKTHLDVFHGIDAFLEFQYGDDVKGVVMATMDLTTRPKKLWKADVLIVVPDEGFDFKDSEDKQKCMRVIEDAAQKLAHVLYYRIDHPNASAESPLA